MSLPVTKTLYHVFASFSSSTFGTMMESASSPVTTSNGWIFGTNNIPLYCPLEFGTRVTRTNAAWDPAPTGSSPTLNTSGSGRGNCWAAGPFSGEFFSGSWQITMSMKPVTRSDNSAQRLIYRLWKGTDISGSDASLLSSTFISSSVTNFPGGGGGLAAVRRNSASISLNNTIFRNEYLFQQIYYMVVTAGGNIADDLGFVHGPNSSYIQTTPFVQSHPSVMKWTGNVDD